MSDGWTVTQELGMERLFTRRRMLWVVRFNGVVYGKRHRSKGKAERFVEKVKTMTTTDVDRVE